MPEVSASRQRESRSERISCGETQAVDNLEDGDRGVKYVRACSRIPLNSDTAIRWVEDEIHKIGYSSQPSRHIQIPSQLHCIRMGLIAFGDFQFFLDRCNFSCGCSECFALPYFLAKKRGSRCKISRIRRMCNIIT